MLETRNENIIQSDLFSTVNISGGQRKDFINTYGRLIKVLCPEKIYIGIDIDIDITIKIIYFNLLVVSTSGGIEIRRYVSNHKEKLEGEQIILQSSQPFEYQKRDNVFIRRKENTQSIFGSFLSALSYLFNE